MYTLFLFLIYKKQQILIYLNSYCNANVLLKKTHNSYFIVPKNQVVHKSVATFFLNSKIYILTKSMFYWLEVRTEILSFLYTNNIQHEKNYCSVFLNIMKNLNGNQQK